MTPHTTSTIAREEQILAQLPQVRLLAKRLHRRCPVIELDDLISAGTIGLIKAVDAFDPSRNLKLKTYAEHRIRGALLDYLRQLDPLPRQVRQFQKRRDALIRTSCSSGERPNHARIAEALDLSIQKYVRFSRMITAADTLSLEEGSLQWRVR